MGAGTEIGDASQTMIAFDRGIEGSGRVERVGTMSALVLVADPDPFNLRLLQEACEAAGYDVITAADGPDVLAMVARQPPDLLVLDANMSEIDAFEVLRILKADASLDRIPVLLVTEEGAPEDRRRGIELGAEDTLTRPYRVFEIQQRVRNVLRATRRDRLGIPESAPPADQRDPVTGAGTPSQLLISLDYEHTRATRYGHPLTCMVIRLSNAADLAAASEDGTADRAMASIGAGLKGCIRAVDHLFRLRRDEFCILLPETDGVGAGYVYRRLKGQAESGELWGRPLEPTPAVDISVVSTPETGVTSGDDLLKKTRHGLPRRA